MKASHYPLFGGETTLVERFCQLSKCFNPCDRECNTQGVAVFSIVTRHCPVSSRALHTPCRLLPIDWSALPLALPVREFASTRERKATVECECSGNSRAEVEEKRKNMNGEWPRKQKKNHISKNESKHINHLTT